MLERNVELKVKKLSEDAKLPEYRSREDSGADIYALEEVTIQPNEYKGVHTGIAIEVPQGHEIQVRSKSGLALKHGLFVLNSPGTVDEGYRGEITVIISNQSKVPYTFNKGDKVAQIVLKPVYQGNIVEVNELSSTERGDKGFGSSGK